VAVFKFKQFSIHQDQCAMKVGTDGTLLGAWVTITTKNAQLLDIGTGTGLLPLMLAQRYPQVSIHAVEIDPKAYKQAQQNFQLSHWSDRLQLSQTSIQAFGTPERFDHIISNPPFYDYQAFSIAHPHSRQQARATTTLSHSALLEAVKKHLQPTTGIFSLILPYDIAQQFILLAMEYQLYPIYKTTVLASPKATPFRLLLTLGQSVSTLKESELTIRNPSGEYKDYHPSYRKLLKDFLIIF